MKNKVLTILSLLFVFAMVATPALAATSTYEYDIFYRVDGGDLGHYHTLDKGTVYIIGHSYYNGEKQKKAKPETKGETVSYKLYRDGL